MESAQAPLIAHHQQGEDDLDHGAAASTRRRGRLAKGAVDKPGVLVLALTVAAGISGLLFGYDTGVISAALISTGTSLSDRELTSMDKSIITSSTSLFALLASPLSSVLADRLGRKRVILYADILFMVGAMMQAACASVALMVAGRCVVGAAVGAASFVVPLYIAELAPASHRGRLITASVLFISLGQVVAYVLGWALSTYGSRDTGWRWMVGLGAMPAALQAAVVFLMPETPRWLVRVGRSREARAVVQRVNGGVAEAEDATAMIREIETEVRQEEETRRLRHRKPSRWNWLGEWRDLVGQGKNRRALAIACLLQGLQQLCGFNSLMYFSATIFMVIGFDHPTLTSLTVAATNFLFTLVALELVDRIGRRRVLLWSIPFMMAGLLLTAVGFSSLSMEDTQPGAPAQAGAQRAAYVILISIIMYVASYAVGLGNVPWMQSELFPLSVRSLGSGIATGTNWSANFVVGLTFLPLMDALSPSWTFVLYACICGIGYGLVWRMYPETAGLSLEEATALLERGWGV
ncbi:hypothetical protein E4U42_006154 [Claviceps africana]|uniref:Major facilitator superfamily (MFS) profile domain-containing protein n=1 Tax=Claviceps africana TaxID=83212 RepID=A0A8K0J3N3_9HYPO|nr:hypothetical protein E4U42_006154 [Claviceps africana]